MADITNPEVIRFVNEQIRPLCEEARAFNARVTAMHNSWIETISQNCPADSSPLADGREAEGVSRLTGYMVAVAHDNLKAMSDEMNVDYINPPCVRVLSID